MATEKRHLSGRVNKRQIEQLEKISREEKSDRSSVLRKLLDLGLNEYNREKAVEQYRKGKISIGRAAEIAGVSISEFYKILEIEDVPVRIDIKAIEESLESDFGKKKR
ncbi:MAG: UPF0175 family protein [Nitrososphaerales archaeon]